MVLGDYIVQDFKPIPPKESLNEVSPRYIYLFQFHYFTCKPKKLAHEEALMSCIL